MVQRLRLAVMKDAPIKFRKEGFVSGMGQRLRNAAMKDVLAEPRKEEYVSNMVQSQIRGRLAVTKDAPTLLSKEECV